MPILLTSTLGCQLTEVLHIGDLSVPLTYLYLLSIESQLWSRDNRSPFWSAPDWTGVLWWSQPILLRTRSLPPELHLISTLGHSWHYGGFFFQFQSVTFLWLVSVSIFLILYQQSIEIYQDGDYWFLLNIISFYACKYDIFTIYNIL